jgi:hypothetical protein
MEVWFTFSARYIFVWRDNFVLKFWTYHPFFTSKLSGTETLCDILICMRTLKDKIWLNLFVVLLHIWLITGNNVLKIIRYNPSFEDRKIILKNSSFDHFREYAYISFLNLFRNILNNNNSLELTCIFVYKWFTSLTVVRYDSSNIIALQSVKTFNLIFWYTRKYLCVSINLVKTLKSTYIDDHMKTGVMQMIQSYSQFAYLDKYQARIKNTYY